LRLIRPLRAATLGIAASLVVSASAVTTAHAFVRHEETVTGANSGAVVSTSTVLEAVPGDLYLVAVSTKPPRPVDSVTGLGLAWTPVAEQCGGRSQTGVALWKAIGELDASGPVTATLASAATNVVIAVSRYSGADPLDPLAAVAAANTNGLDGACAGGVDSDSYAFDLPVEPAGAVVWAAVAHRHYSHAPGEGLSLRAEIAYGTAGETASVGVIEALPKPGDFPVTGTFGHVVDWVVATVVLRPVVVPEEPSLTVTTTGLGAVVVGPPGGRYVEGDRVALVATPIPGWRFDRWQGAVSGSANPESVTVAAGTVVEAVFEKLPRHAVELTTIGAGNVMISPPGGVYPEHARVKLTAQPAPGWHFVGWSGSIGGTANPRVVTMNGPRDVGATFALAGARGAPSVAFEEAVGGGSAGADTVASAPIAASAGALYLAAVSSRPSRSVVSVTGLGLGWTLVAEQCSARDQTDVSVWVGRGDAGGDGTVTATLDAVAENAAIAVARYSGADAALPLGAATSVNFHGVAGSCAGGEDASAYSFELAAAPGALVFGAIAHRHRLHAEGPGLVERAEVHEGIGGVEASVSLVDGAADPVGTTIVSGTFSGIVDWAGVAVELRPAGEPPAEPLLGLTASGLGSVELDPPAELHEEGTVVTLTAVPHAGWEFDAWSGALSGSGNPDSVTASAGIQVAATFRPSGTVALRRTSIGAGGVAVEPAEERYVPGASVSITAAPRPGWSFDRWGGAATGAANPATVTIGEESDLVAFFSWEGEARSGLWSSPEELVARPLTTPAWHAVHAAADAPFVPPDLDRSSSDNVECLAAAIVHARTGDDSYRRRVVAACSTLAANGHPGDETLAWAREVGAYALAADLVGYRTPELEDWFRNVAEVWTAADARTLLAMFRQRPNNWGTSAFGTLAAVYAYLGDTARLSSIRQTWVDGVCGPDPGYQWGEPSWHADPADPRQISPPGSSRDGLDLDGALPDDVRRGGTFSIPPVPTEYPWGALQGLVMAARILERYDPYLAIWHVGDDAVFRAARLLQVVWDGEYGGWAAAGDDAWMLPFLDDAYGTTWSHGVEWGAGKNTGWAYVLLPPANETGAPTPEAPSRRARLQRSAPNPFASATELRYSVAAAGRVEIGVYDVAGRLVTTILDGFRAPGSHVARWNGVDAHGRPVASGIYWVRLHSGDSGDAIKVTLVRR